MRTGTAIIQGAFGLAWWGGATANLWALAGAELLLVLALVVAHARPRL